MFRVRASITKARDSVFESAPEGLLAVVVVAVVDGSSSPIVSASAAGELSTRVDDIHDAVSKAVSGQLNRTTPDDAKDVFRVPKVGEEILVKAATSSFRLRMAVTGHGRDEIVCGTGLGKRVVKLSEYKTWWWWPPESKAIRVFLS